MENDVLHKGIANFKFHDLDKVEPLTTYESAELWTKRIEDETINSKVVSHYLFQTPLGSLGRVGPVVQNLKFVGEDYNLHHRFVIVGLKKEKGDEFFLSFEKGQDGILVQMAKNLDDVNGMNKETTGKKKRRS